MFCNKRQIFSTTYSAVREVTDEIVTGNGANKWFRNLKKKLGTSQGERYICQVTLFHDKYRRLHWYASENQIFITIVKFINVIIVLSYLNASNEKQKTPKNFFKFFLGFFISFLKLTMLGYILRTDHINILRRSSYVSIKEFKMKHIYY